MCIRDSLCAPRRRPAAGTAPAHPRAQSRVTRTLTVARSTAGAALHVRSRVLASDGWALRVMAGALTVTLVPRHNVPEAEMLPCRGAKRELGAEKGALAKKRGVWVAKGALG
eukprot:816066-Rhodomonas_salina.1